MSNLPQTFTPDETIARIDARGKEGEDLANNFFLKVYRRPVQYGRAAEHQATFNGASVIHFGQPEAWLPAIFGGGDFELYAYDPAEPSKRIGSVLHHSFPAERKAKPNFALMELPDWRGPKGLVYPAKELPPVAAQPYAAGATTTISAGYGPPQGQSGQSGQPAAQQMPDWYIREKDEALKRAQALELELARERAERRMQQEMDRVKAESDRQIRELRESMQQQQLAAQQAVAAQAAAQAAAAAAKPQPTTVETISMLATALMPLAQMFMNSSEAARKAQADQAAAAATAQQTILAKLSEPKGMTPEVTMLLELMKNNATASGDILGRMVESTQAFNSMAVSMIETIAQHAGGGEPGNPVLDGVKEIIKAVASANRGAEAGVRRQAQVFAQPPMMPAGVPHAAAQATGPQTPVGAGFAEYPQGQATPPQAVPQQASPPMNYPVQPNSTVDAIEGLIRNHAPVDQVVRFILSKIDARDPDLAQALSEVEFNVEELIATRLGAWALPDENSKYLDSLGDEWVKQTAGRPDITPAPDDGEDDGDQAEA